MPELSLITLSAAQLDSAPLRFFSGKTAMESMAPLRRDRKWIPAATDKRTRTVPSTYGNQDAKKMMLMNSQKTFLLEPSGIRGRYPE
jgi:hypothetical protein